MAIDPDRERLILATGFGLARTKHEGHTHDYETGEDLGVSVYHPPPPKTWRRRAGNWLAVWLVTFAEMMGDQIYSGRDKD
jgi:hypothetical protein